MPQSCNWISFMTMKSPLKSHHFLMLILGTSGAGCLPEPQFPDVPAIGFVSMEPQNGGGRELVISFTDGDGDVGLSQADTLPPFCSSCIHHQNLKLEYEEWRNGAWVHIPLLAEAGQVPFYYRVPRVTPTGQNPALQGTIAVDMPTWFLNSPHDSVRFRIELWDRSLHVSNSIYTPILLKP